MRSRRGHLGRRQVEERAQFGWETPERVGAGWGENSCGENPGGGEKPGGGEYPGGGENPWGGTPWGGTPYSLEHAV